MGRLPATITRGTWGVMFRRAADGHTRTVYMEYPTDKFYNDCQLDAPKSSRFNFTG